MSIANDLSMNNILIDVKTYKVFAFIYWEYSGFFPAEFEKALWRMSRQQWHNEASEEEPQRRLAALLDETGKIETDTLVTRWLMTRTDKKPFLDLELFSRWSFFASQFASFWLLRTRPRTGKFVSFLFDILAIG